MVADDREAEVQNIYLEQAKTGRNEFWRYLVVNLAIIGIATAVSVVLVLALYVIEGTLDINSYSSLGMLLAGMLPFPFALAALLVGVRYLHGRRVMSLINPGGRFNWRRFFISGGLWFLLSGVFDIGLSILQPGNYVWAFDWKRFLPYALAALILTPFQTSTEELIFRGYLQQGLARLAPGIWLPLIVSSLVFGLLHGVNPEVGMYGMLLTLPVYIGIGLLLGYITLRSQSLELALGLHLANNLYAGLMVTFPGSSLPSPALFSIQQYHAGLGLVNFFLVGGIYLALVFALGLFKPPAVKDPAAAQGGTES